jgi:hypothetical protein
VGVDACAGDASSFVGREIVELTGNVALRWSSAVWALPSDGALFLRGDGRDSQWWRERL